MLTTIIFIVVLSILVFVHELGHFIMAKRAGMKVEEFGFGFPPRLVGMKRGDTTYSINWIPFGGFVQIFGEDGQERDNPRSFAAARALTRAGVIIAGVVMNFLLAVLLLTIVNSVGLRVGLVDQASVNQARDIRIQIVQVAPKSPAELAGLSALDEIAGFRVNDKTVAISSVDEVQRFIANNLGHEVVMLVGSDKNLIEKKMIPRANPPPSEGALGISLTATGLVSYPFPQSLVHGVEDSVNVLGYVFTGYFTVIKNIFLTGRAGVELSGPVGIAVITGRAARLGLAYLMQFTALISINLAVLNIIPFPALDGGRLLFVGIEKLRGRPVPKKIEQVVNAVGFTILILLMLYVTTKDIIKFF